MKEPSKTKFEIFLQDGQGQPTSDLSASKINVRQLVDLLFKKLDIYQKAELYMDVHFRLGEPDESMRLFFQTLIILNKNHLLTALGLRLRKGTVAQRLYRLKQELERRNKAPSKKVKSQK